MYADIIVDISREELDQSFQYRIPEELQEILQPGMRVKIPFGKGKRTISGYVIDITDMPRCDTNLIKEILSVEPRAETIESKMISLAAWMRREYGSTMLQALRTVLPVKTKVMARKRKWVRLAVSRSEAQCFLEEAHRKHYHARVRLMEALLASADGQIDPADEPQLKVTKAVLDSLEKAGMITVDTNRVYRGSPSGEYLPCKQQIPDRQQQTVIDGIRAEFTNAGRPCLLYGVTGSGKTLVYMELIRDVLEEGRQAIVLIPEIALTHQTVARFYACFGDKVSVLHSRLSQGERCDQMEQVKTGQVQIMIGPRSALFTPFANLGLIIIDEEHEHTYQSETMPRYDAREVAIERCRREHAHVVFGSATPSIDSYERASRGIYAMFQMLQRYEDRPLPKAQVIDLRQELKTGNRSMLSSALLQAMKERLARQEQTLLFLNRRGYAGFVSCRSCGYVAKCPHCDVSLSLHVGERLLCHYCGYERPAYNSCPVCGSPYIGRFKAGTQQMEEVIKKMFPTARVLRMDADTTRKKEGYRQILESFARQEADILIGTQMIVKGHDFPAVTLVGVLAADLSLNDSDFRSGERTFQLLTQVIGRAGRGQSKGEAVIQTYQPDHYSIQAAVTQDYRAFYEEEMLYRRLMQYPPASAMMAILGGSREEELLEQGMRSIRTCIERIDKQQRLTVIGPAPAAIGKVQDVYRSVIYVRHQERQVLTALRERLEEYIVINSGFREISIQFDFHC